MSDHLNPYQALPNLSTTQAAVLWEYAKLAHNVRTLTQITRALTEQPDQLILPNLRILEKKMGLVLTLFKASVWGVINDQPDPNVSDDLTTRH